MTQTEFFEVLKKTGYPVAYHHFSKAVKPPYVVYTRINDTNISSDLKVHSKFKAYQVELYTLKKDEEAERIMEALIESIDTDYTSSEEYIESENLFQVVYEMKIRTGTPPRIWVSYHSLKWNDL